LQEVHWTDGIGDDIVFNGANILMAGVAGSVHFDEGTYLTSGIGPLVFTLLNGDAEERDLTFEPALGPGFGVLAGVGYEFADANPSFGLLFQALVGLARPTDERGTEWNLALFMPGMLLSVAQHWNP
jgi:hypothetical protein